MNTQIKGKITPLLVKKVLLTKLKQTVRQILPSKN